MSIFGQKKLSVDEIIKGIERLSDEDRAKLNAALAPEKSPEPPADESGEDITHDNGENDNQPGENVEEETNDAEESNSDDHAGADEAPETEEQSAEDMEEPVSNDAESVKEPTVPSDYDALFSAMESRLTAMSELVATLTERCNALTERLDNGSFGNHSPGMPSGDIEEDGDDSPVIRSYMRKQTYR